MALTDCDAARFHALTREPGSQFGLTPVGIAVDENLPAFVVECGKELAGTLAQSFLDRLPRRRGGNASSQGPSTLLRISVSSRSNEMRIGFDGRFVFCSDGLDLFCIVHAIVAILPS